MTRIIFHNQKTRNLFFDEIKRVGGFRTWKEMSLKTHIPKSMLENYRTGKLLLPSKRFETLITFLPPKTRDYYVTKVTQKEDNWGVKKGGKATYTKHPEIFEMGRKKGIESIRLKPPKYEFDINMKLNESLCELVGAFIGDGFTNKYGSSYITQFTGHSKLDNDYYDNTIIPIIYELFGIQPCVSKKGNVMRVTIYSKRLFELFTKRLKLNYGKKVYTTKIPMEIIHADEKLLFAAIRGVFDTDGCVFVDKRPIYKRPYPRITLQTASEPLYIQLKEVLEKHFSLYTSKRKDRRHYIEVYGHKQLKRWDRLIGFSNERHDASVAQLVDDVS